MQNERSLAHIWNLQAMHLELTLRCNLRCVYCAINEDTHQHIDMPFEAMEQAVDFIIAARPRIVCVSGGGESTLLDNWYEICDRLLAADINLHIISNFAKRFSDVEIDTLSRFYSIQISIDTPDEVLLAATRKKVDFRTIVTNIVKINQRALANVTYGKTRKLPILTFCAAIYDKNISHLESLLKLAAMLNIRGITLNTLLENSLQPSANIKNLAHLAEEDKLKAQQYLNDCLQLAERLNINIELTSGLKDAVFGKEKNINTLSNFVVRPKKDETRFCSYPWSFLYITADRQIRPCPSGIPHEIGTFLGQSLTEIMSGDAMFKLRTELLTGELGLCRDCHARPLIKIDQYHQAMESYLNNLLNGSQN